MRKIKSESTIQTKQGLRLSPQQLMLSNMIQASGEELQKIIHEELESNVALESDDTRSVEEMTENPEEAVEQYDDESKPEENDVTDLPDDYIDDDMPLPNQGKNDVKEYSPLSNYGSDTSFRESLKEQMAELEITERDLFLANYLVDSLEDDGYLRRQVTELVNDLSWHQNFDTTQEELERVLVEVIQANAEPVGIGARDLRECLLLQLYEMQSTKVTMKACQMIEEDFTDFMKHRYDRIQKNLGFSDSDLREIQKVIRRLNPKPGGLASSADRITTKASQVRPDFIVTNEEGTLIVSLSNSRIAAVRVSPDYNEMLQAIEKEDASNEDVKKGKTFIENGIRKANLFINALVQRRHTLINSMRAIVKLQYSYFLSGNIEDMRPMGLKDVAKITHYDISTLSRVCSSRFVQTDFGIIALKSLFTSAVQVAGGDKVISNLVVKNALKEIVDNENKEMPFTDGELKKHLSSLGYDIARRTVVKYRTQLGIPKHELRKI